MYKKVLLFFVVTCVRVYVLVTVLCKKISEKGVSISRAKSAVLGILVYFYKKSSSKVQSQQYNHSFTSQTKVF